MKNTKFLLNNNYHQGKISLTIKIPLIWTKVNKISEMKAIHLQ